jgi:hypothetical protein
MCKAIHFFEGELRLIAECLRCAAPQNPAKQPPSTHGVATQEEIEKYLKQLKRDADLRVIDTTVAAFARARSMWTGFSKAPGRPTCPSSNQRSSS